MNIFSRCVVAAFVSTLFACGGASSGVASHASGPTDEAAWRPSDATELSFAGRGGFTAPSRHLSLPVALRPNRREVVRGQLHSAR